MLYPLDDVLSKVMLAVIIVVVTAFTLIMKPKAPLLDLTIVSAFFGAIVHTIYATAINGISPFFPIGFGVTMLTYLIPAFVVTLLVRVGINNLKKGDKGTHH